MVRVSKAQSGQVFSQDVCRNGMLTARALGEHVQQHAIGNFLRLEIHVWGDTFGPPFNVPKVQGAVTCQGFTIFRDTAMHRGMSKTIFGRLHARGEIGDAYVTLVFRDDAANGIEPSIRLGSGVEQCKASVKLTLKNLANEFETAFDVQTKTPKSLQGVEKYILLKPCLCWEIGLCLLS